MNDNKTYTVAEAAALPEGWVAIPGTEAYEAARSGQLRSLTHYTVDTTGKTQKKTGKLLKPSLSRGKYHVIRVGRRPCRKQQFVHRLIAATFIPNPEGLPQVNHKNGVKTDNRASNLEWVSTRGNQQHRRRVLKKNAYARRLKAEDAIDIRILRAFGATLSGIAAAYNITTAHASAISRRVNWSKL